MQHCNAGIWFTNARHKGTYLLRYERYDDKDMKGDKKQSEQVQLKRMECLDLEWNLICWCRLRDQTWYLHTKTQASWKDGKMNLSLAATINLVLIMSDRVLLLLGLCKIHLNKIILCLDRFNSTGAIYTNGQGDKRPISLSSGCPSSAVLSAVD